MQANSSLCLPAQVPEPLRSGPITRLIGALFVLALAAPVLASILGARVTNTLTEYSQRGSVVLVEVGSSSKVSYQQVLEAVYTTDAQSILASKKLYRDSHPQAKFVSDYENEIGDKIKVIRSSKRIGLSGLFSFGRNLITLYPDADVATIYHEAGHGIQKGRRPRKGERFESSILSFAQDARKNLTIDTPDRFERFKYLTYQHEFEIRLQDLNRYHYELTGKPILRPVDALRALHEMGIRLCPSDASMALNAAGDALSESDVKDLIKSSPRRSGDAYRKAFPCAFDLEEVIMESESFRREKRDAILIKILLEAPGHA